MEKWIARLRKVHGKETQLRACYEAGPCGFGVARRLQQLGVECDVVAPSMTPTRSGDRVKTDRRDARKLARLLRAGELSSYLQELDEVDAQEAKEAGPERLSATELKEKIAQLKQRQEELRPLAEEVEEKGQVFLERYGQPVHEHGAWLTGGLQRAGCGGGPA